MTDTPALSDAPQGADGDAAPVRGASTRAGRQSGERLRNRIEAEPAAAVQARHPTSEQTRRPGDVEHASAAGQGSGSAGPVEPGGPVVPGGSLEAGSPAEPSAGLASGDRQEQGGARSSGGLHGRVLDHLGLDIAAGALAPGRVLSTEQLEAQLGVSRSVIREAVRVLASMGMVAARRRVGVVVQPAREWNLFDPQVIRWRLASPDRNAQVRSLTELRAAVEPQAARLAALRARPEAAARLMGTAGQLWAAGQSGDLETFLRLDIEFHRQVLACSGNEMFEKMHALVGEVLIGRTQAGMMPAHPHPQALQAHMDVASAIGRGDAPVAQQAMADIVTRTMNEMSAIWHAPTPQPQDAADFTAPAEQESSRED